jgi:hypothetical protein
MVYRFNSPMNRTMTEEQFCQVVDAILNGKYSWACLLILKFAGYNPLHYIPYRTYNRLMKENSPAKQKRSSQECNSTEESLAVSNLPYLQTLEDYSHQIKGGFSGSRVTTLFV